MRDKKTFILATGFVLLWNSGFVGAEYGLPYTGPFTLLFWRYLAVVLILLGYLLAKGRLQWVGWRAAAFQMGVGVLAHGAWLACVLLALDNGVPAGIVALVVALQPLATGALSGLVTGEPTRFYQWVGLSLGFIGVLLTVAFRIDFKSASSVFGYLIPLGAVIGITVATLAQRRQELKEGACTLAVSLKLFYQSLGTVAAAVIPAIGFEKLATQWEPAFIYAMAWLAFAVSLGAYALMWRLIERINATRVASLFYLGPPVTMFMAWIAFGDQVKVMDAVGIMVVFAGVGLAQLKAAGAHSKT